MNKPLRIAGITFLLVFLAIILIPFLFKEKIGKIVKSEINKKVNAKVDFSDADLSLIRHFPNLSLRLENLNITGTDIFDKDTLLSVKGLDLSLDLLSVIKGSTIKVNGVELDRPRIFALVDRNGNANWNIFKPDTAKAEPAAKKDTFAVHLNKYGIRDGYIFYNDEQAGMSSRISNLNHEGKGDFTSERFTLETSTTAKEVDFSYGGIKWVNKVNTSIDAAIEVDNKTGTYSFSTDQISLNELKLAANGFFRMAKDRYDMDIKFKSLSASFKSILSFVPAIYQHDFESIKTSGALAFDGQVKGTYAPGKLPGYNVNLDIKDGFFQYPDLPKAVKNVNLKVLVKNPDGVTDHTIIDIPQGHIEMDRNPFDFRVNIKQPVSALFVDAAAKGVLDLSQITSFVKLDKGTSIGGILNADLAFKGSAGAARQKKYDQMDARGKLALKDFIYRSADYPEGVKLTSLLMSFNPRNVTVNNMAGNFMNTNFTANGTINNILPYLLRNEPLDGTVNLTADKVDLNKWMGTSTAAGEGSAASAPFAVPANLNMQLNAKVASVHYDKLDIRDLSGALKIAEQTVELKDIKGNALDGSIGIGGSYSTRLNKKKPDISLNYDVKDVDIQKTFYAFNTVQKLMPVGKFLAGKLSSSLNLKGQLGDNMMPSLASLTGNGNVLLLQGVLNKFQPLEKMASTLNINSLKDVSVKDIKSYFEFAGGKVLVKPFNLKIRDIDMEVGGLHGFDQSLDYTINLKVPRELMGEKGNALVSSLVTKAANKGVAVNIPEKVNLQLKMQGTIGHPLLKTSLKENTTNLAQSLKEQSTEFVKTKVEVAKKAAVSAAKDSIASAKRQLAKSAAEELAKKLSGSDSTGEKQSTKKSLEETGKGLIKGLNPFKKKQ